VLVEVRVSPTSWTYWRLGKFKADEAYRRALNPRLKRRHTKGLEVPALVPPVPRPGTWCICRLKMAGFRPRTGPGPLLRANAGRPRAPKYPLATHLRRHGARGERAPSRIDGFARPSSASRSSPTARGVSWSRPSYQTSRARPASLQLRIPWAWPPPKTGPNAVTGVSGPAALGRERRQ